MIKSELLIIDMQNDFCEPDGALYVQGAVDDSRRLADFINRRGETLSGISMTLDSHHLYDIAHPLFWVDENGNHPGPFTLIREEDVAGGKWRPSRKEEQTWGLEYVKNLAEQGKYTLCIWPPHCLIGSWGTQVQRDVLAAVNNWERGSLSSALKLFKGENSRTEHYGAFKAEVSDGETKQSSELTNLTNRLNEADEILVAGEALDYCVATTVRQLTQILPEKELGKIFLLEDCCSSVDPSTGMSEQFLMEMKDRGIKLLKSTER